MALEQGDAQRHWVSTSLRHRLDVLRAARHVMVRRLETLADCMPHRDRAESLVAEVLPLLAACRYLEKNAERVLRQRVAGRNGRPLWLAGVTSVVRREPLGRVLVIAPANYPLLLAGVQILQALVAGNAVVWKPAHRGSQAARAVERCLLEAGLPEGLLIVTEESVQAAEEALAARPDQVVFTGSAEAGKIVLRRCAELGIPAVMELSGCDAVVALPSADRALLVKALLFGMRLNGSATCMAPRRLIVVGELRGLEDAVEAAFAAVEPVSVTERSAGILRELLAEARTQGADVRGEWEGLRMRPVLVRNGNAAMRIARSDIFAPVLTVLHARDEDEAVRLEDASPLGLTAAVFGEERAARRLAGRMRAGTVLVNDVIVPTADPRLPFGGRKDSGFGVTRGAEGLLQMTQPKIISVRRGGRARHLEPTTEAMAPMFEALGRATYGSGAMARISALLEMVQRAAKL